MGKKDYPVQFHFLMYSSIFHLLFIYLEVKEGKHDNLSELSIFVDYYHIL